MDCHCIPFTEFPQVTGLFTDYLYHYSRVQEFYPLDPFDDESFTKAAQTLPYSDDMRREVVAVLTEQNRRFSGSEKTLESLRKLGNPDCYAVVTGQQVGLFTGPTFAFYKALTAIKWARTLSARGLETVPVFWLATEDHDLEEVTHCFVQDGAGEPLKLEYPGEPPVANAPVGTVRFTEAIQPLLDALQAALPDSPERAGLLESLSECYRPGESFGTAFGRFMARLFGDFGVILVDPMDARLHRLSSRVFRTAIESAPVLLNGLLERDQRLAERGYHVQVRVTESSSLLFLYADGQRTALRLNKGRFVSSLGQTYSPAELLARLESQPEVFSPNVLLRPVMQDMLLPTIAYVGGPSELAYLAQAGAVYERALGRMPVVLPRASLTVLEGPATRILAKYGLTLLDVCAGKQALREKMAARFLPVEITEMFQKTTAELDEKLEAIQKALGKLDPTLVDAAANSGKKMQYQLASLERKAAAAVQGRSEQIERDAVRLENSLYPRKTPQERVYSGISYLARYGPQFLNQIYEQIPLHVRQHQLITL